MGKGRKCVYLEDGHVKSPVCLELGNERGFHGRAYHHRIMPVIVYFQRQETLICIRVEVSTTSIALSPDSVAVVDYSVGQRAGAL